MLCEGCKVERSLIKTALLQTIGRMLSWEITSMFQGDLTESHRQGGLGLLLEEKSRQKGVGRSHLDSGLCSFC